MPLDFLKQSVTPLVTLGISFLIAWALRSALYRLLGRWAQRTHTQIDDVIVGATRGPSLLWVLMISGLVTLRTVQLSERIAQMADKAILALLILSLTLVAARLLVALIQQYADRLPSDVVLPMTGLTQTITQAVVLIIGFLVLLSTLGVNITPLLTALGVSGLAVALALQDTLSNLFAGLHVLLARQIAVGNRIRLDTGEEGYVIDVGWRSTTLRTPTNHLVIIPNAKLAQSIVTNYNRPDPPVNIVLRVGISYDADPEYAERVLYEEARRAAEELPGFVKEFDPVIRFQAFGESSLDLLVILQVETFDAQFPVWGELHKRIFKRLQKEKIEIPYPHRTVYLRGVPASEIHTRS